MADAKNAHVPTWLTILAVAALALGLWALVAARGAASTAEANAARLARPDLDVNVVPGGPQRFPDAFDAAVDDADDAEGVDPTTRRWVTVVVHNDGSAEAEDTAVTLDLGAVDTPIYLADLPGFLDLDVGTDGPLVELDVGDIEAETSVRVFVGIPAAALPEAVAADWPAAYRDYIGRADVFADGVDVAVDRWFGGPL